MSAIDIKDTVDTSTPALLIEVPAKASLACRSSDELSPLLYIETFFSTIIERLFRTKDKLEDTMYDNSTF